MPNEERNVSGRGGKPRASITGIGWPTCVASSVLCGWLCFALGGEWWLGRLPIAFDESGLALRLLRASSAQDLWAWWLYSSRKVLFLVGGVLLLSVPLGALLGALAAFAAPVYRATLARLVELSGALPALILLGLWRLAQDDPSYLGMIAVLGALTLVQIAHLVTQRTQTLRQRDHLESARALGATPWHLFAVYILPQLRSTLTIAGAFGAAWVIVLEAALTFVGLGVPNAQTWGSVLGDVVRLRSWSPAAVLALFSICAVSLSCFALGSMNRPRRR